MNLFSVSKNGDICVCLKYWIEVGDGVHFCNNVNSGVHVTRGKATSPFAPVSEVLPSWATHTIFSIASVLLFNYLFCCVFEDAQIPAKLGMAMSSHEGLVYSLSF